MASRSWGTEVIASCSAFCCTSTSMSCTGSHYFQPIAPVKIPTALEVFESLIILLANLLTCVLAADPEHQELQTDGRSVRLSIPTFPRPTARFLEIEH